MSEPITARIMPNETMRLGDQLRVGNLRRAFEIVDSLPQHKDQLGGPKYTGSKELRKWKAAAYCLAEELRRIRPDSAGASNER